MEYMESAAADRAIRQLLNLAQNVEDWNNPRAVESFVRGEKAFGWKGDNLLHVLIQRENPSADMGRKARRDPNSSRQEMSNTLWMDAPSRPVAPPSASLRPAAASATISAVSIPGDYKNIASQWTKSRETGGRDLGRDKDRHNRDTSRSNAGTTIDKGTDAGIGRNLLIWMLRDSTYRNYFYKLPSARNGRSADQEKLPVHLAIAKRNLPFLACFLGLFCDPKAEHLRPTLRSVLAAKDSTTGANCVHFAVSESIPFASTFVAVCDASTLSKTDHEGFTPLHRAMKRPKAGLAWKPPKPASFVTDAHPPVWEGTFDPARIFEEVLARSEREEAGDLMANILTTLNAAGESPLQTRLLAANGSDRDLLVEHLKATIFETVGSISSVSTALYGTSEDTREIFLNMADFNQAGMDFESFVDKLTEPSRRNADVIAFEDTLFFVHLPDLNYVKQPCSHSTIRKLFAWLQSRGVKTIKTLRIPDSTTTPLSDAFVQKYVLDVFRIESLDWRKLDINLDILSNSTGAVPPSAGESRESSALVDLTLYSSGNWSVLYHWMSKDGLAMLPKLRSVRIHIVHLSPAPGVNDQATHKRHSGLTDAYKSRMDDEFQRAALQEENPLPFVPEIQTDVRWDYPLPPQEPEDISAQTVRHQFTNQLQPTFDALCVLRDLLESDGRSGFDGMDENRSMRSSLDRANYYDSNNIRREDHREDDRGAYRDDFRDDARDYDGGNNRHPYQIVRRGTFREDERGVYYENSRDDDRNDNLRYHGQEVVRSHRGDDSSEWKLEKMRFQDYALGPTRPGMLDKRIRVAILDNGADRIRSRFRDMIAKGQSYVTTDELHGNQPLPWWMVSDPHGTQMASLISQVNQYCRLYIARVGMLRNDIRADSAVKAIEWAIKHDVDVLSISWTLRTDEAGLQEAISKAARKRILIFCSTPDEGMYSEAWPVGYTDHVFSVSATDQYGYLTSKARTASPADVLVPGENLRAAGPAYIGNVSSSVSGSSVATALAAGIASMALLLLHTFNGEDALQEKGSYPKERHRFYTKAGMLKVFRRMGPKDQAVLLSKMFPQESRDKTATLQTLAKLWRVDDTWK